MSIPAKIILNPGKDEAIKRYHPWVFSGAIKKIQGKALEGDLVEVYSSREEYLACGFYQAQSIAVRLLAFNPLRPHDIQQDFWNRTIATAYELRKTLGLEQPGYNNVYRLIHGEGDGLPGLIIDHYHGNLVVQAHAIGMHMHRHQICQALQQVYGTGLKSVYYKSKDTLPARFAENQDCEGFLFGDRTREIVQEHGHEFEIDFVHGQKTGFFIDQRENRALLAQYAKGRKVLNTFCYSGGFSVYAAKAGASLVASLDSSKKAIELTERNMVLNFPQGVNHLSIVADAMEYIRQNQDSYDLVVLDPPAFAKHTNVRHNAVQGYKRLNAEAIRKIAPGGILFTFSCSQVVNMGLFKSTVIAAAIEAGRKARIIHQLSQPADHPINAFHPEGEYLKGLVLFIE